MNGQRGDRYGQAARIRICTVAAAGRRRRDGRTGYRHGLKMDASKLGENVTIRFDVNTNNVSQIAA